MKRALLRLWMLESQIRAWLRLARFCHHRIPIVGRPVAMLVDRLLFLLYGLDVVSSRVRVAKLSISHPGGVLLGGNGIVSDGRVAIMAGVKFVGRSPTDPAFMAAHRLGEVFRLGDNVVFGANTVVVGPLEICDNVIIGAMSLVNRSISEPGTYVGIPARRIGSAAGLEWVQHL